MEASHVGPLFWEGSAKRDIKKFPEAVQKDMGVALYIVQSRPPERVESRLKVVVRRHRSEKD